MNMQRNKMVFRLTTFVKLFIQQDLCQTFRWNETQKKQDALQDVQLSFEGPTC